MPHAVAFGSKLRVRNGISISAVQPVAVRRTRAIQIPSHDRLMPAPKSLPHPAIRRPGRRVRRPWRPRVDLEEVSGATVEEGVDRPHESIVGLERPIALHLVAEHAIRLAVVADHAEQQPVGVVDDAHFGALGRRGAVVRLALQKAVAGRTRSQMGSSGTPSRRMTSASPNRTAVMRARRAGEFVCASAVRTQDRRED